MISGYRIAAAAAVALATLTLAACGDLEDEGSGDNARGDLTQGTTSTTNEPARQLPPPPPGVVRIDGAVEGSLTEAALLKFVNKAGDSGLAVTTDVSRTDETAGFQALCDGLTDLVDSSRSITPEELESCDENGLEVVQFKIAFDATVIATRNERDVGADCVNFDQLRAMYGAGSAVDSWIQLNPNFYPLRLIPVGPTEETTDFQFFGSRVLLDPAPTYGTYRSDYQAFETQDELKDQISKNPPGVVGIVSFSFYELFEDKLRPLEIDGQTGDRCVFPSTETIASELYPLQRTLSIFATQRSLDRQEVQTFLDFYLNNAEALANKNELIPIPDAVRAQEIRRLTDPDAYAPVDDDQVSEPSPDGSVTTTTDTTATTPTDSTSSSTSTTGSTPTTTASETATETTTTTTAP